MIDSNPLDPKNLQQTAMPMELEPDAHVANYIGEDEENKFEKLKTKLTNIVG